MIKHIWSVLCEHSLLDQETKLLSLINVLEEFHITAEPDPAGNLPVSVSLVTLWTRSNVDEPSQGFARYSFASPKGRVLKKLEQPVDLSKHERLRARGQFVNLPIAESGQYSFNVDFRENEEAKWKKVAAIPLKVDFQNSGAD